ncbi:MAG TPA: YihY family inner membrane protein [Thermoanaerobaculia bacterium]|jgi:membrane protein|nr:YihY family inner membrane protein [Thermoanaerobaculia bacterium]
MDDREIPASKAGPEPRRLAFHRQLGHFFAFTLRQGSEDSIFLTASALAFVTILSLVPLLAALSFVGARVFSQYPEKSLEVFIQVLPYSEKTLTDKLREFLDQAETMHGVGLAALFGTTLLAFATIEETFNKIWHVSRRRSFRHRLLTFFLLLFWGPLLIGVTFSSLILLRQTPAMRELVRGSVLLHLTPFLATVVGLTLLNWLVPSTRVRFRNALVGGLFGAILLEVLRQSFGYYVEFFRGVSTVYGSSAFVLLFMISIELTWTIVLLGSEAAYTAQHFALLSRGLHTHPAIASRWVGLAAVAFLAAEGRAAEGEPPLTSEQLAAHLSLAAPNLERTLHPLLAKGLLRETPGRGYVLGRDPATLRVEEVFEAYDHRARRSIEHVGAELRERLDRWVDILTGARADCLGAMTVAELLAARAPAAAAGGAGESAGPAGGAATTADPAGGADTTADPAGAAADPARAAAADAAPAGATPAEQRDGEARVAGPPRVR